MRPRLEGKYAEMLLEIVNAEGCDDSPTQMLQTLIEKHYHNTLYPRGEILKNADTEESKTDYLQ